MEMSLFVGYRLESEGLLKKKLDSRLFDDRLNEFLDPKLLIVTLDDRPKLLSCFGHLRDGNFEVFAYGVEVARWDIIGNHSEPHDIDKYWSGIAKARHFASRVARTFRLNTPRVFV